MLPPFTEDTHFQGSDFLKDGFNKGEYENCNFDGCLFAGVDVSRVTFVGCTFKNCDFSLAKVIDTAFRDVRFIGCKLLGVHFENASRLLFVVSFENCNLNLSSFYQLKLKGTSFKNCNLQEVDFSGSDMTGSVFDECDLSGAIFRSTILEKVDFRTAYNYSINPEYNRISKAKFSISGVTGLLDSYGIVVE